MKTRTSSLLLMLAVLTSGCFKITHDHQHQHQHVHHNGKPPSLPKCMTKPNERKWLIDKVTICNAGNCKYEVEAAILGDPIANGYLQIKKTLSTSNAKLLNPTDDFIVEIFEKKTDPQTKGIEIQKREFERNAEEICIEPVRGIKDDKDLVKITYPFTKDKEPHELIVYIFKDTHTGDHKFFYYIQHTKSHSHALIMTHDESAGSGSRN